MPERITPTLSEVLRTAIESYVDDLYVALPCRVLSYDSATQLADLQPNIKRKVLGSEGSLVEDAFPVLANVPVAFPRAGDWFMSMPVTAGDNMLVVFSSRSFEDWRDTGLEIVADDIRSHPLNGAIAIPCNLYPKTDALGNAHASKLVVGKDTGARIYIDSDQIDLYQESASEFVALATKTFNEINALRSTVASFVTTFNAHTHVETGGTTAPPAVPASSPAAVASVAAAKVKAT